MVNQSWLLVKKKLRQYDTRSGQLVRVFDKGYGGRNLFDSNFRQIKIDDNKILASDFRSKLQVIDWNSGICFRSLSLCKNRLCFDYSDEEKILVTGDSFRTIKIWSLSHDTSAEGQDGKCVVSWQFSTIFWCT